MSYNNVSLYNSAGNESNEQQSSAPNHQEIQATSGGGEIVTVKYRHDQNWVILSIGGSQVLHVQYNAYGYGGKTVNMRGQGVNMIMNYNNMSITGRGGGGGHAIDVQDIHNGMNINIGGGQVFRVQYDGSGITATLSRNGVLVRPAPTVLGRTAQSNDQHSTGHSGQLPQMISHIVNGSDNLGNTFVNCRVVRESTGPNRNTYANSLLSPISYGGVKMGMGHHFINCDFNLNCGWNTHSNRNAVPDYHTRGPLPVDLRFTPSPRTNIPPQILPLGNRHQVSVPVSSGDSSGLLSPLAERQDPFDSPPRSGNQQSPGDYLPLNECSSGGMPTPAPRGVMDNPVKAVTVSVRNQPRHASSSSQRSDRESQVYKVPPLPCSGVYQEPSSDSTYDCPVSSERECQRDSNYDYPSPLNSWQDEGSRDLTYDYPPSVSRRSCGSDSERPLWECESKLVPEFVGDTYDLLPPRPLVVPPRNSIGVAVGDPHSVYDIPASCRTSNLPPTPPTPPKAHPVAPKVHRYINAAPAVVSGTQHDAAVSNDDSAYLAMCSVESGNNVYMPMSEMDDFDGHCRRMLSTGQSSSDRLSDKPPKAPVTLPRSFARESEGFSTVNHVNGFVDSCHAAQRTRSFIRHIPSPSSDSVILPQKVRVMQSSSSSEDEDETSSETNSVQEYLNLQVNYSVYKRYQH